MDYLEGPDDATMVKIQAELGEDPERMENNLKLLEEWMSFQNHLPQNYGMYHNYIGIHVRTAYI